MASVIGHRRPDAPITDGRDEQRAAALGVPSRTTQAGDEDGGEAQADSKHITRISMAMEVLPRVVMAGMANTAQMKGSAPVPRVETGNVSWTTLDQNGTAKLTTKGFGGRKEGKGAYDRRRRQTWSRRIHQVTC